MDTLISAILLPLDCFVLYTQPGRATSAAGSESCASFAVSILGWLQGLSLLWSGFRQWLRDWLKVSHVLQDKIFF